MRCPSCGAIVNGAVCDYCGSKMPAERVETQAIHGENVVVNNFYYPESQQPPTTKAMGAGAPGPFVGINANSSPAASPKSRMATLLLCFFFGVFGAHRFYAGRYLMGVLYFFTFSFLGVGWLVDMVLILLGKMRDRNGLAILDW